MIKVSVIIPVYNMEKYLEKCLISVCEQNIEEMEIICINDGSKDSSLKILEHFAEKSDKIKIIDKVNQGVSAARNDGLEIAKGEFIAFMDADDFYPEVDVLSTLYNIAKEQSVLVCGGSMQRYDEINGIKEYKGPRTGQVFGKKELLQYEDYQEVYGYTRFIYNKKMLLENKIYFPPNIRCQDPPFFLRAMLCAKKFYATDKVVYCVRTVDKKIAYETPKVLGDVGKAFKDMLKLSKEFELNELYTKLLTEFVDKYEYRFYKEIYLKNVYMEEILEEIGDVTNRKFCTKEEIEEKMKVIQLQKKELQEAIKKYETFIIYGAGMVGKVIFDYLTKSVDKEKIKFAVTELKTNNISLRNIKVQKISDLVDLKKQAYVFIAATANHQSEMETTARELGFEYTYTVNFQDILLY